jgi:hypothetical protein
LVGGGGSGFLDSAGGREGEGVGVGVEVGVSGGVNELGGPHRPRAIIRGPQVMMGGILNGVDCIDGFADVEFMGEELEVSESGMRDEFDEFIEDAGVADAVVEPVPEAGVVEFEVMVGPADAGTVIPKQEKYADSSTSAVAESINFKAQFSRSSSSAIAGSYIGVMSGTGADDVNVVIEVTPVPEHADLVEHSVAKNVVPLPVTIAVPRQS